METERDRDLLCSGEVDDAQSLDEGRTSSSSARGGTWADGTDMGLVRRVPVETQAGAEMGLLGTPAKPGRTWAGSPLEPGRG
jgi:hypothetical protein